VANPDDVAAVGIGSAKSVVRYCQSVDCAAALQIESAVILIILLQVGDFLYLLFYFAKISKKTKSAKEINDNCNLHFKILKTPKSLHMSKKSDNFVLAIRIGA
jgi:hypothetical protein